MQHDKNGYLLSESLYNFLRNLWRHLQEPNLLSLLGTISMVLFVFPVDMVKLDPSLLKPVVQLSAILPNFQQWLSPVPHFQFFA